MRDQLQMFNPETCGALPSVISSAESWAGALRCASPAGPTPDPSGQALAHASHLAAPGNKRETPMKDTYGPNSSDSSKRAGRQSSLASKSHPQKLSALSLRLLSLSRFAGAITPLPTELPTSSPGPADFTTIPAGSMEYEETWVERVTPSGLRYWAHTARARRTSGKGSTGWRSPSSGDSIRGVHPNPDKKAGQHSLNNEAALSGWPTPNAMAGGQTSRGGDRIDEPLMGGIAKLCGWPTPQSEDSEQTGAHRGQPDTLNSASKVAGWGTPKSTDAKGDPYQPTETRRTELRKQVSGTIPSGTHASTAKPAASRLSLNPFFSAWLMGFPREWTLCGLRALASLSRRKSKGGRASSKATATPSSPS